MESSVIMLLTVGGSRSTSRSANCWNRASDNLSAVRRVGRWEDEVAPMNVESCFESLCLETRCSNSRAVRCTKPWRSEDNQADLRRFSDQPVAEIVQCGEPHRKINEINNLRGLSLTDLL